MTLMTFAEAFLLNPSVKILKGSVVPFVEMSALRPFVRDVRSDGSRTYSGGSKFLDGDVLMARITPSLENGKTSIYRAASGSEGVPAAGSTEFIVIRGRPGVSTSDFAYYVATSQLVRDHAIGSMNGSSGRQRVQFDALANLEVELPSMGEQLEIAAVLSSIDDKIEHNQQLIAAISDLLRAYVTRGIQDGSTAVPVSKLATFVNGGAYTKGSTGTGRMVLRIAELNSGPGASTVYNDIDVPEDRVARPGDILMSWSGTLGVYRWFRDEAIVNQHIFKVLPTGYPAWLVFDRLEAVMPIFQGVAQDKATTMGHIKRSHLEETEVLVPDPHIVNELDQSASPLWQRMVVAERECVELALLRDALRPELISGRLRVQTRSAA